MLCRSGCRAFEIGGILIRSVNITLEPDIAVGCHRGYHLLPLCCAVELYHLVIADIGRKSEPAAKLQILQQVPFIK